MNLLEYILNLFRGRPLTKEEQLQQKRRDIETRRAEVMLKLTRERDNAEPDPLKLDRYERELAVWEEQLKETAPRLEELRGTFKTKKSMPELMKEIDEGWD